MVEQNSKQKAKWPEALKEGDVLYAIMGDDSVVEYLVFSSVDKKMTYVRDNGNWTRIRETFFEEVDDPSLVIEPVDISFIEEFDKKEANGEQVVLYEKENAVTAAAPDTCPPATQDIGINLKNRKRAINNAGYGPLNPEEPNEAFWENKASLWSIKPEEAKTSLCGNCAMFTVTTQMKDCIATGISQGGSSTSDAWDAIDAAQLGYCEAFDFKCAATRTCDAWVTGGPIDDAKGMNNSNG
jgi:hypothetical protein